MSPLARLATLLATILELSSCGPTVQPRQSMPNPVTNEAREPAEPIEAPFASCRMQHLHQLTQGGETVERILLEQTFSFDPNGAVASVTTSDPRLGGIGQTVRFHNDEAGRVERVTRSDYPVAIETRAYDSHTVAGSAIVETRTLSNGDEIVLEWTFDALGRIRRVSTSNPARTGGPTRFSPPPPATAAMPRLTECEWVEDRVSRIVTDGAATDFSYDARGRLSHISHPTEDGRVRDDVTYESDAIEYARVEASSPRRLYRRFIGRCEDVMFQPCSPGFAPPPPTGTRPSRLGASIE